MSSEKMREEFEAWFEANKHFMLGTRKVSKSDCFFIWQASRAAVVVELPSQSEGNRAYNQGIYDAKVAIEAAGLQVAL